jgi:hypothetical protein
VQVPDLLARGDVARVSGVWESGIRGDDGSFMSVEESDEDPVIAIRVMMELWMLGCVSS